jgi:hypothetical protein
LVGVSLVLLAFFAGVGLAILAGIKVNITIAWTLPFIILGLGVDDVYIVLMSLKKQAGYKEEHFVKAMKDVVTPVTMTSLVNASMFAVMNSEFVACSVSTSSKFNAIISSFFLIFALCYQQFPTSPPSI